MPLPRTAQLGLLAKDLAVLRLAPSEAARDRARQRLVDRLGLLHGLPQKIGQLLAFSEIDHADPAFTKLTENEPSLSPAEARVEVERQLGGPLEEFFATFEPRGIAASIGQVHRATLHDGRTVAVKLQHPGIAETIDYDLRALGWLTAPVGDLRRGFDLEAYRREIGLSLRRELDYREEAAALRRFRELARSLRHPVAVPEVIPELSHEHLLVTTWLYGEPLTAARRWPAEARARLATSLLGLFFTGVTDWGLIHADPHPGNYRFLHLDGRPTVGLLDFGCMKTAGPALQQGISGLVADALDGPSDAARLHDRFSQMGFNPLVLDRLRAKLPAVGAALTAPFTTSGKFDSANWRLRERLGAALGDDRMAFRTAGPPEMIFILRAFQGLLHYLKFLDAPVDWRECIGKVISNRDQDPSRESPNAKSQAPNSPTTASRSTLPPDPCALAADTFLPSLSSTLRIQVQENGLTTVSLSYGAEATERLAELVPPELHSRLSERSIDLAAIAAAAGQSHYAPGELFSLREGVRTVRVWLE